MESFTITVCLIETYEYISQHTQHIRSESLIGACASLLSTK